MAGCRHLTKTGAPCKGAVTTGRACQTHADDLDRSYADGHHAGWQDGYQCAADRFKSEADRLRQRVAELTPRPPEPEFRTHDRHGRQIVVVNHRYAYLWSGQVPLEVGEEVQLPANWVCQESFAGVVTGLGSSYDGPLSYVLRRLGPPPVTVGVGRP